MRLEDYTDKELEEEVKRRKILAYEQRKLYLRENPFIYWKGVIVGFCHKNWGSLTQRYRFRVKHANRDQIFVCTLLAGKGYSLKSLPKLGDSVSCRYRNGNGYTCNIEHYKIVKVIDNNEKV